MERHHQAFLKVAFPVHLEFPQHRRDAGLPWNYDSVVTLAEIQAGIEITREQDASKAAEIESWVNQVSATHNVLYMDAVTFRLWAKLMHRQSDTVYEDAIIAATAIAHKLTVVTRNMRDF